MSHGHFNISLKQKQVARWSPFCTILRYPILVTDHKFFLKTLLAPIYTNFKGGAQVFGQNFCKKWLKTPFLKIFFWKSANPRDNLKSAPELESKLFIRANEMNENLSNFKTLKTVLKTFNSHFVLFAWFEAFWPYKKKNYKKFWMKKHLSYNFHPWK